MENGNSSATETFAACQHRALLYLDCLVSRGNGIGRGAKTSAPVLLASPWYELFALSHSCIAELVFRGEPKSELDRSACLSGTGQYMRDNEYLEVT